MTWQDIAFGLGLNTPQAAKQRYADADHDDSGRTRADCSGRGVPADDVGVDGRDVTGSAHGWLPTPPGLYSR